MKLHFTPPAGIHLVDAFGPGFVVVGERRLTASLLLMPNRLDADWCASNLDDLTPDRFAEIAALKPELVLLGTGERQRFPAPVQIRALIEAGIGVEAMTTGAACRTYNILASEGRRVAALLLIDQSNPA